MMALDLSIGLATLASGLIVGTLLGLFGGGGSVLAAPLLLYLVGVSDPHVAIGTSAAAVAAIALFSLMGHWRGGAVKWPCAIFFALAGLTGSWVGSSLAKRLDGDVLLLAFAAAMAAIALTMGRRPDHPGDPGVTLTPALALRLGPTGLITGGAAGFFGIGGGFLIVPGLMLAAGMPLANATASSLVSVALFGAVTASNYFLSGYVDLRLAGLLLAGGAAGGAIGVVLARTLAPRVMLLRRGFAAMVLAVAIYVAWQAITVLVPV